MAQDRRTFLALSGATAGLALSGCSRQSARDYEAFADGERKAISANPEFNELVRAATLAPNGHNTQPWRFAQLPKGALITPDFARRTPIVDPDDHHLFVSLGCAAENFLVAASAQGRPGALRFDSKNGGQLEVELGSRQRTVDPLAAAIPARQSTRSDYDSRPVATSQLRLLEDAARIEGVSLMLLTDNAKLSDVQGFLIRGNDDQMNDSRFVQELHHWIRFNPEQALVSCDGLFTKCSGNPALPSWVGKRFFSLVYTKHAEDKKYAAQIRSSAGVAVFVGDKADKEHWVRVGRSFERFALMATTLGIRNSMINQPVEVPSVRDEFARWLGIGDQRPDLVVRFGYGSPMPMSLRRPAKSVIVAA